MGGRYYVQPVPPLAVVVTACEARTEDKGSGETTLGGYVGGPPAGDIDVDRAAEARSPVPSPPRDTQPLTGCRPA
jgi:hypothetical protein